MIESNPPVGCPLLVIGRAGDGASAELPLPRWTKASCAGGPARPREPNGTSYRWIIMGRVPADTGHTAAGSVFQLTTISALSSPYPSIQMEKGKDEALDAEEGEIVEKAFDVSVIPQAQLLDVDAAKELELEGLGVRTYDPDVFERNVMKQLDTSFIRQDRKTLATMDGEMDRLRAQMERKLRASERSTIARRLNDLKQRRIVVVARIEACEKDIQERAVPSSFSTESHAPGPADLIRQGLITPFGGSEMERRPTIPSEIAATTSTAHRDDGHLRKFKFGRILRRKPTAVISEDISSASRPLSASEPQEKEEKASDVHPVPAVVDKPVSPSSPTIPEMPQKESSVDPWRISAEDEPSLAPDDGRTARQRLKAKWSAEWAGKQGVHVDWPHDRAEVVQERQRLSMWRSQDERIGSRFGPYGTQPELKQPVVPGSFTPGAAASVHKQFMRLAKQKQGKEEEESGLSPKKRRSVSKKVKRSHSRTKKRKSEARKRAPVALPSSGLMGHSLRSRGPVESEKDRLLAEEERQVQMAMELSLHPDSSPSFPAAVTRPSSESAASQSEDSSSDDSVSIESISSEEELSESDDLASSMDESEDVSDVSSEEDEDDGQNDHFLARLARAEERRDSDSLDDGEHDRYKRRLMIWKTAEKVRRRRAGFPVEGMQLFADEKGRFRWIDSPDDVVFDGGLRLPRMVDQGLFPYQRTGVKWLWELHCQNVGGIVGDEMGLGKTIEIAAFLAALQCSGLMGPSLLVCPATVMRQWVREIHKWWPPMSVVLLHDSGFLQKRGVSRNRVIDRVASSGHLLITTYEGMRKAAAYLQKFDWDYLILDEGHRIRNADADITLHMKRFSTSHRILLTGAPIQNNLTELWSLMDFVYPGLLGTLPVFQAQFVQPITLGGFASANAVQVQTAYQCAVALREQIAPYLLRRLKKDVNIQLPGKTEQVLFCELTPIQRTTYEHFLDSPDMQSVFAGRRNILFGIDVIRKICNHPDLLTRGDPSRAPADFGSADRSGKLVVVRTMLHVWQEQGHRALIFVQTRQMLDIMEAFVHSLGLPYLRMDGTTPISGRMALIDKFNFDDDVFLFLLTTKVGGLGTNLTGADRVLIYDPDWNPSTDLQARERAWRIGQTKPVTIYRLITAGTIEEKIYHRQIYKQFLTNKILRDPRQRRFFSPRDLQDLFSLSTRKSAVVRRGGTTLRHPESRTAPPETALVFGKQAQVSQADLDEDASASAPTAAGKGDDNDVLQLLLGSSGVATILKHDKIMDAAAPEKSLIQREAQDVANKAIQELGRSRQNRERSQISIPTWTGRSGDAGSFPQDVGRPRFGRMARQVPSVPLPERAPGAVIARQEENPSAPSSASLIRRLQERQNLAGLGDRRGRRRDDTGPVMAPPEQGHGEWNDSQRLVVDTVLKKSDSQVSQAWRSETALALQDFLLFARGHAATADEIVRFFGSRFKGMLQKHAFREMLRRLAEFEDGKWRLRDEFCP